MGYSLIHCLAVLHRSVGTKILSFISLSHLKLLVWCRLVNIILLNNNKFLGRDPKAELKSYKWLNTWDKLKVIIFIVLHFQSLQSIINCVCCGHSKIHCCRKSSKPNVLAAITLFFEECFNFTLINGMSRLARQHKKCLYSPFKMSHGSWGGIILHLWAIMTEHGHCWRGRNHFLLHYTSFTVRARGCTGEMWDLAVSKADITIYLI